MTTKGKKAMKMKILIVDDDWAVRESLSVLISGELEATLLMAPSAEAGLLEFAEEWPDIVITDRMMETDDAGLWLAAKIKLISPETPVIMAASYYPQDHSNIDAFLEKPSDVANKIVATIRELIARRD